MRVGLLTLFNDEDVKDREETRRREREDEQFISKLGVMTLEDEERYKAHLKKSRPPAATAKAVNVKAARPPAKSTKR